MVLWYGVALGVWTRPTLPICDASICGVPLMFSWRFTDGAAIAPPLALMLLFLLVWSCWEEVEDGAAGSWCADPLRGPATDDA